MAENLDDELVQMIPAKELVRFVSVFVPRVSAEDKAGPENGWDYRWPAACEVAGDDDALAVFKATGRMVALRNSDVWQALCDGAGGYDDTIGNPFAPFAFGSGIDTQSVSRRETIELGLIDQFDEEWKPTLANPAIIPSPEQITERLAEKTRQYLAKLEEDEQKRRRDTLTFGTSDDLVELAEEKIDSAKELTP